MILIEEGISPQSADKVRRVDKERWADKVRRSKFAENFNYFSVRSVVCVVN